MNCHFALLSMSSCVIGMLPISAGAQIYQCFAEDRIMNFQDRPCDSLSLHIAHDLPSIYRLQSQSSKEVLKKEKSPLKTKKKEQIAIRKKARLDARAQKQEAQRALQEKNRITRCEKTAEKIKNIQSRLNAGCKSSHCLRLKEQLLQEKKMKERYCG